MKEIVAIENWYQYSDQLYYVELKLVGGQYWSGFVTYQQWQEIKDAEMDAEMSALGNL